jgi:hypothetical protein
METKEMIFEQVTSLKRVYDGLELKPDEDEIDFLTRKTKLLAQIVRVENLLKKPKKEVVEVPEPEEGADEGQKTSVRSLVRNLGGDSAIKTVAVIV